MFPRRPPPGQRHKTQPHPEGQTWPGSQKGSATRCSPRGPRELSPADSDHRALPQEPGQWPSRPGLGAQAAGESPSPGQQPGAIRPVTTSRVRVFAAAAGPRCLSGDRMEARVSLPDALTAASRRGRGWPGRGATASLWWAGHRPQPRDLVAHEALRGAVTTLVLKMRETGHREASTPVPVHTADGAGQNQAAPARPAWCSLSQGTAELGEEEPRSGAWGRLSRPGVPTACGCHSSS